MTSTLTVTRERAHEKGMRPLSLGAAIVLFAVPAFAFRLFVYDGMAWLLDHGVRGFEAFLLSFGTPLAIMLFAALVAYRIEGNAANWQEFAERMRLRPMHRFDWLWTLSGFLVGFLGSGALMFTAPTIARLAPFAPPASLPPLLNPLVAKELVPKEFLGAPLAGNWTVVALYLALLFFNIVGEELWWRGYILPRQELTHGRWTWVIHGVLWTLFHVPIYPWNVLVLLPTCLSLSFVAQRTRNTWPGMITHFVTNGLAMVPIVLGVISQG